MKRLHWFVILGLIYGWVVYKSWIGDPVVLDMPRAMWVIMAVGAVFGLGVVWLVARRWERKPE